MASTKWFLIVQLLLAITAVVHAGCASDCAELGERCRECGRRLGYTEGQLSWRCSVSDGDEDACEQELDHSGGCGAFLDENLADICDCR